MSGTGKCFGEELTSTRVVEGLLLTVRFQNLVILGDVHVVGVEDVCVLGEVFCSSKVHIHVVTYSTCVHVCRMYCPK